MDNWWPQNTIQGWPGHGFMMKLKGLKSELRKWNLSQRLSVARLPSLVTQLKMLDDIEDRVPLSMEQISSRRLLREQIEDLSAQEHIYWHQRCKLNWLREGDENTNFSIESWLPVKERISFQRFCLEKEIVSL